MPLNDSTDLHDAYLATLDEILNCEASCAVDFDALTMRLHDLMG